MSTSDPGRPEDRPPEEPGYPPAPPPPPAYGEGQYPAGGSPPPEQPYPPSQQPPSYGEGQTAPGGYPPPEQPPAYGGGQPASGGYSPTEQQPGGYASGPPGSYPPPPAPYPNAPQYGRAPEYGTPYGPPAPVAPPREVVRATQLMFLRVAIGVISAIITFTTSGSIKDRIRTDSPNLTPQQVDSAYAVIVGSAIFIGLIFAVLYILLAIQVRRGKNWARIVVWVLAGLGVLSGLFALGTPMTGADRLLEIVQLLVDAAIIVLLALRPSNEYFAARRAPRY